MDFEFLSQPFLDTLSPQPEPRRRAEESLSAAAANTPNYGVVVLGLVSDSSVDEQIRLCAAINLKNHLKTRWVPLCSDSAIIPDGEKEQIKTRIVPLMLSATGKIQAQLSDAIAVIGDYDFPENWPELSPDIMCYLEAAINANEYASVNGILATLNSLLKRFRCGRSCLYKRSRYEFKSNRILFDLEYCSNNLAAPLLSTVESITRKINGGVESVATLRQLLEARRLCCRIFYSLNVMDAPEKFKDNADKWMNEFKSYLTKEVGGDDADCLSLVDDVRAAVCENISLYIEREKNLFLKHSCGFVDVICRLVGVASASEWLTMSATKFLNIVSEHDLFVGEEILQRIVITNVMLRDEDEELAKKDYVEFIRRDMEGNDLITRRRIAIEFLKGIAGNYKEKISTEIQRCLALFAENTAANWKYKECAIYLVVSLAKTKAGASVSTDLVDVEGFFRSVIVPELQGQDVNAFPMLKAAALKFFTMFRVLIPKHVAMPLLGDVVHYISSDVGMVCSYAAICIEKLLLVKDNGKNGVLQARYTSKDIKGPLHKDLCYELFEALKVLRMNHYIMRCIMRLVQILDIFEHYEGYMNGLFCALKVSSRGKRGNHLALYYHYLFEAVASLVRRTCEKKPGQKPRFLTGMQNFIFRDFIDPIWFGRQLELLPYAFQLVAQLLDLNTPCKFMDLFDEIFMMDRKFKLWENFITVPSLVRLLQSYLQHVPDEVNKEGRLRHVVLGIINELVSTPTTEEQGFQLLNQVIHSYGYDVVAEYMNHIWASVFNRLQSVSSKSSSNPRLARCVILFMSLFLVKHGLQTLVDLVNSIEVNFFHDVILDEFWIPTLRTISSTGYNNYTEVKLIVVASTRLLFESASLLDPAAEELWGKLLDAIVSLLSLPLPEEEEEEETVVEDEDEPDLNVYPRSRFFLLQNAGKIEEVDPLKEIQDLKQFLVTSPGNFSSQYCGIFPEVEVMGHEPGLYDSWHPAIVISARREGNKHKVQYTNLYDESGKELLKEWVPRCLLRPMPPPVGYVRFIKGSKVDVFSLGSWWPGTVQNVNDDDTLYDVKFKKYPAANPYEFKNMRIHQVWRESDNSFKYSIGLISPNDGQPNNGKPEVSNKQC